MSLRTILTCDMEKDCTRPVTHIDNKGFVYCTEHGNQRKYYHRCRQLAKWEIESLLHQQPISYERRPKPKDETRNGCMQKYCWCHVDPHQVGFVCSSCGCVIVGEEETVTR